jgi:galactofuranose transport system permease protein
VSGTQALLAWLSPRAPRLAGACLLVVIYAAARVTYADQGFGSLATLLNILDSSAVLGVIAVGLTFVIISGGIDLSVGAVMALSSVAAAQLLRLGAPLPIAVAGPVLGASLFGATQGWFIHRSGLAPFIVTLATMFLARGLSFMISLEPVAISSHGHGALAGVHMQLGRAWLRIGAVTFLLVTVAAAYTARFTRFGRAVYALGGSDEAATLMGLRVRGVRIGVYTVSALCSAIAGILLTFQISSGSHLEGFGLELDAIAAVVIGGTLLRGGAGSVLGTLVGVLLIGIVVTVITTYGMGTSSGLTKVLIAALLLGFIVLQNALMRVLRRS